MSLEESVIYLDEREVERFGLAGCEGLRSSLAVAEFAAHRLAADKLIITADQVRCCADIGVVSMRLGRRCGGTRRSEVLRVDVDELHVKVGVGAAGGDVQLRAQRADKRDGVEGGGVGDVGLVGEVGATQFGYVPVSP